MRTRLFYLVGWRQLSLWRFAAPMVPRHFVQKNLEKERKSCKNGLKNEIDMYFSICWTTHYGGRLDYLNIRPTQDPSNICIDDGTITSFLAICYLKYFMKYPNANQVTVLTLSKKVFIFRTQFSLQRSLEKIIGL